MKQEFILKLVMVAKREGCSLAKEEWGRPCAFGSGEFLDLETTSPYGPNPNSCCSGKSRGDYLFFISKEKERSERWTGKNELNKSRMLTTRLTVISSHRRAAMLIDELAAEFGPRLQSLAPDK